MGTRPESPPTPAIGGYILAGGACSRFGRDKARALLWDQPLLHHAAATVSSVCEAPTVVADTDDKYADLGLRTIADRHPGMGPLAGIHRALLDHPGGWLIVTSCDQVGILERWIAQLVAKLPRTETRLGARTAARAIAFAEGERWEPFPALYHPCLLPDVERRLADGPRSVARLLDAVATHAVTRPAGWDSRVTNINTLRSLQELGPASPR